MKNNGPYFENFTNNDFGSIDNHLWNKLINQIIIFDTAVVLNKAF